MVLCTPVSLEGDSLWGRQQDSVWDITTAAVHAGKMSCEELYMHMEESQEELYVHVRGREELCTWRAENNCVHGRRSRRNCVCLEYAHVFLNMQKEFPYTDAYFPFIKVLY